HVDEVFVKIAGETCYLWRAIDHEGEILEAYVTKSRDKAAALKFLRKAMKRYGSPKAIVTDGLTSYGAAMKEIGNQQKRETKRYLNNQIESSHLSFRRRERAMQRFRQRRRLQKFAAIQSSVYNHVNLDRHLTPRAAFKTNRDAALQNWQALIAA
ncbi:MAG: IS6 family transposase, partial [Geminicoccales bacterium]